MPAGRKRYRFVRNARHASPAGKVQEEWAILKEEQRKFEQQEVEIDGGGALQSVALRAQASH